MCKWMMYKLHVTFPFLMFSYASIQRESLEQNLGDINNIQAMKHKDRICLLRLQRNLKELNDIARKKELEVQKHRLVFKQT